MGAWLMTQLRSFRCVPTCASSIARLIMRNLIDQSFLIDFQLKKLLNYVTWPGDDVIICTRCKICVKNYYFCHFHDTLPVLYDFFMQKIWLSKITLLVCVKCKLHFWVCKLHFLVWKIDILVGIMLMAYS